MFYVAKRVAPEPFFSAGHHVLYHVALYMRGYCRAEFSDALFRDLGDAIHNLPAALIEHGHYFDEQKIREEFQAFDDKWSTTPDSISLISMLDAGIELKLKIMEAT